MNTDIRLSITFFENPKIQKLLRRHGAEAVLCLIRLWLWTSANRPTGLLLGLSSEDIEIVGKWTGKEEVFFNALVSLKLLDQIDGEWGVHDWSDWCSWQSEAPARSDAARMSRMAKEDKECHSILKEAGIKGLSKEEYKEITRSNDRSTVVQKIITTRGTPCHTSTGTNPAPNPNLSLSNPAPAQGHAVTENFKTIYSKEESQKVFVSREDKFLQDTTDKAAKLFESSRGGE